jgi:hypothetical protein
MARSGTGTVRSQALIDASEAQWEAALFDCGSGRQGDRMRLAEGRTFS